MADFDLDDFVSPEEYDEVDDAAEDALRDFEAAAVTIKPTPVPEAADNKQTPAAQQSLPTQQQHPGPADAGVPTAAGVSTGTWVQRREAAPINPPAPADPPTADPARGVRRSVPQGPCVIVSGSTLRYVTYEKGLEEGEEEELPMSGECKLRAWKLEGVESLAEVRKLSETAARRREAAVAPLPTHIRTPGLLADRYRPKAYLDLLSEEAVNLSVLQWLKSWDPCVFGKNGGGPRGGDPRPAERVLLLSGPPGAGKTTLVRTVVRHCGYECVEVNASMDRTADKLDERLQQLCGGTQTLDGRPVCLLLDEADGIAAGKDGSGVLRQLLSITKRAWKTPGQKGKSAQRRPVICICNNAWEPKLRELRREACFIQAPPMQQSRVEQRLAAVSKAEGLHADTSTLRQVAAMTDCDIRASLLALDFLRPTSNAPNKKASLRVTRLPTATLQEAVTSVFQKEQRSGRSKKGTRAYAKDLLENHPEFERIFDICYEEYPSLSYNDFDMRRTRTLMRYQSHHDRLEACFSEHTMFGLKHRYASERVLAFHSVCATTGPPQRFSISSTARNRRFQQEQSAETLRSLLANPDRRCYFGRAGVRDMVSPLAWCLSPPMGQKQVATQLMSMQEKGELNELAGRHRNAGVTYAAQHAAGGGLSWRMEPDVNALTEFSTIPREWVPLPGTWRSMVATRISSWEEAGSTAPTLISKQTTKPSPPPSAAKLPSHVQKAVSGRAMLPAAKTNKPSSNTKAKPSVGAGDFLSSARKRLAGGISSGREKVARTAEVSSSCAFKFQEGASEAVHVLSMWEEWM
eukprot:Hpha_TRINITY_DN14245_c0_g2::TRINITY_DN14245_c0_g2_i2::g.22531::m.22531/K11269/CTF18, CHL12; chromosome transmission fidelity protein 18